MLFSDTTTNTEEEAEKLDTNCDKISISLYDHDLVSLQGSYHAVYEKSNEIGKAEFSFKISPLGVCQSHKDWLNMSLFLPKLTLPMGYWMG